jgi:hypothetical protein
MVSVPRSTIRPPISSITAIAISPMTDVPGP